MRFIEQWLRPYRNTIRRIIQEYEWHPEATVDRCSRCSLRTVTLPARKQAKHIQLCNYITLPFGKAQGLKTASICLSAYLSPNTSLGVRYDA
jgi:hypothetical protein